MAKALEYVDDSGWLIMCPACHCGHKFDRGRWTFDGNLDRPTFNPSMLVQSNASRNVEEDGWMPIQHPSYVRSKVRVPMAMLNEERAQRNHGQSLKTLAARGGLGPHEALCNLDNLGLWDRECPADQSADEAALAARVQTWLAETGALRPAVCHSFVRDGRIDFLGDCTHALAGQTVDLPDV